MSVSELNELETESLDRMFGYVVGDFKRREIQQKYAMDPALWAQRKLGFEMHERQIETALAVVQNRNVAVAAGHGTGKSVQAAIMVLWWIDTHPIGSAFVATTAPTNDQISDIIFREMKEWQSVSHERALKGIINDDERIPGRIGEDNTWKVERAGRLVTVARGRKPPDNKAGDAFQGIHARYVLAIGDEATGLSEEMIDGLANITSNDTSRRLLISNPTNPRSYLGKLFLQPTGAWKLIHISVFDLPTFHGGGLCECPEHKGKPLGLGHSKAMLESISGPQFVEDKKKEFGEDSARYKSRVLGQWAFEEGNNLFSDDAINIACDTIVEPDLDFIPIIGVDVARFGKDLSYIYLAEEGVVMKRDYENGGKVIGPALDEDGNEKRGLRLRYIDSWGNTPLQTRTMPDGTVKIGTSEKVDELAKSMGIGEVRVDATGVGQGIIDRMFDLSLDGGYELTEMQGGGPTPDRRAWLNARAYQMDNLRRRMEQGEIDLDRNDETLLDQLAGIEYDFADGQSGGGMKIESKEAMKRRGVKSPDAVDALWMAAAVVVELRGPWDRPLKPGDEFMTDMDLYLPKDGRQAWFDSVW